ncbi:uncharacterized protein M6B38_251190 [Iris pallida]|uniref:Uncharacterized protein n=1 Tax=Iris pallida TaxID=29817 RepID=A0AAX6GDX0_IRIPA|nr:uncharacterized protein M6B38_136765 [Iris pallida]KAJ6826567.1 uncharacterized protein M6B38_371360 [Iris pallida]KAJ6853271.1 uncharacterized protein M6B38_251190 [Iris pallida]
MRRREPTLSRSSAYAAGDSGNSRRLQSRTKAEGAGRSREGGNRERAQPIKGRQEGEGQESMAFRNQKLTAPLGIGNRNSIGGYGRPS